MKTVGWQNYLTYPVFPIRNVFLKRKNIVRVKLQHAGFSHVQVGMATKLFVLTFDSTRDWRSVPVVTWTRAWKSFSDAAIRPWEMHVLYNPDGVVKYSVIHRLRLINSAQLCNKKFQSICWSRNAAVYYLCMRLQAVLIPVVLEISSMSLSSEASRVSFLNQTLLQIENYVKNGQPSFQYNV